MTTYEPLRHAAAILAALCDGAQKVDGVGYSKFDVRFGRDVAFKPAEHWSPRFARAAWKMLRRYRGQLSRHGVEFDSIPEPPEVPKLAEAQVHRAGAPRAEAAPQTAALVASGEITVADNQFEIRFPFDHRKLEGVRQLRGRRWRQETKTWTVPLLESTVEQVYRFAEEYGVPLADEAKVQAQEYLNRTQDLLEASRATDAAIEIPGLGGELLPFQRAGVAYAMRQKRVLIADEMGLGKTVQALATLQALGAFPAVVVCPASLKLNWRKETLRWLPGKTVQVVNPRDKHLFGADVYVLNYDVLHAWSERIVAVAPKAIVFDESHYMKNRRARRTKAAKEMVKAINPEVLLQLTGTPVLNRPSELITLLEMLNRLRDLGGYEGFVSRYCAGTAWDPTAGGRNLEELNEKLRTSCYIRRRKADVLKELPPKRRAVVDLPLTPTIRREYDNAADDLLAYVAEAARRAVNLELELGTLDAPQDADRLRDRVGDEAAAKAERAEVLVRISTLKQLAARGKMEAAFDWIDNFLETGEKLVLFGWHNEMVQSVAHRYEAPVIMGSTSVEDRQAAVERFQTDPDCRLIVGNIQAMGVGLTLTSASNVAFLELPWRPADLDQAEDRCHRIGQEDTVTAWYLLAPDTIDQDIYTLIESKRAMVDQATDGDAKSNSVAEILRRLTARAA